MESDGSICMITSLCTFSVLVPLDLSSVCPLNPLTHTAYKITVVTNRTPPQLTALFDDLLSLAGAGMSQALATGSAGEGMILAY